MKKLIKQNFEYSEALITPEFFAYIRDQHFQSFIEHSPDYNQELFLERHFRYKEGGFHVVVSLYKNNNSEDQFPLTMEFYYSEDGNPFDFYGSNIGNDAFEGLPVADIYNIKKNEYEKIREWFFNPEFGLYSFDHLDEDEFCCIDTMYDYNQTLK